MAEILEYREGSGRSPFREWFDRLDAAAARKVTVAIYRLGMDSVSNVKSVGSGVCECKIHFGAGYRVYFGREGGQVIILLGGGTKRGQQDDIRLAVARWRDYKQRKKQ